MNSKIIFIGIIAVLIASFVFLKQVNFQNNQCTGNFTATVKRIIDGDTIVLNECNDHIRLSLANTPEVNENGWAEATNFTADLCKVDSQVTIVQDLGQPHDVYGRIVAKVYCQNENLNAELIRNNLAAIETQYCRRSEFATESWAWNNGCEQILEK